MKGSKRQIPGGIGMITMYMLLHPAFVITPHASDGPYGLIAENTGPTCDPDVITYKVKRGNI